ncbi:MAG: GTPase domain-containing protein [Acidobacteria bacterium]|nr:GTPase domain-containing protein [Acidobacteriota bacterium]
MVFFNYATMQMAAKIVYYGPGLCGKTTNLHYIYQKTSPGSRGEMVSLETETDRTLFFDLLPIDVGVIGGFKTRLQLYTVPGQVFYNTTRKLVLKGADGIVFVADSQKAMVDANMESLGNLRENLAEIGLELDEIPVVVQLNKRDLSTILPAEELQRILDPDGKYEFTESSAVTGQGVFETLKLISKLTLKNLRKRMMGDEPATKVAPIVRDRGLPVAVPEAAKPIPKAPTPQVPPPAAAKPAAPAPAAPPAAKLAPVIEAPPVPAPRPSPPEHIVAPAAAAVAAAAPAAVEETPEVKHVKVRSSVDVMAELDALRKKATQGTKKSASSALDALSALGASAKRSPKTIGLKAEGAARANTKRVRITVQMEDGDRNALQVEEQIVELQDTAETYQVNLKIDFGTAR